MAKKNRLRIQFGGFEEYAEKIDKLNGDLKSVMTEALIESKKMVTPGVEKRMRQKHYLTGETEESIDKDYHVNWKGTVGEIKIGFDFYDGGLPSIFLMYGTPKMKPDKTLYNLIYGAQIKKKIRELQQKIFEKEIDRLGG